MSNYFLRLAQPTDLPQLLQFEYVNLPDAWNLATLQAALSSKYQQIWLLELMSEPGIKAVLHWTYSDKSVDILNFALVSSLRQKGLGKQLLKGLFAFLTSSEAWLIWQQESAISAIQIERNSILKAELAAIEAVNLEVRIGNKDAISCYESLGFVCLRKVANFYKEAAFQAPTNWDYQGEAALCMQKKIR